MPRRKSMATGGNITDRVIPKGLKYSMILETPRDPGTASSIAWFPDGKHLVSASHDGKLRIWEQTSGRLVQTLESQRDPLFSVTVSRDGRYMVSGSSNGTVEVWELASAKQSRLPKVNRYAIHSLAAMKDGQHVVSGSEDNTVIIWDITHGTIVCDMVGHSEGVYGVAVSDDGQKVVSGSSDGTVIVWNIAKNPLMRILGRHSGKVRAVAITADGRYAVSGSLDKTVKVWDTDTGNLLRTLEGHTKGVHAIALSPDGCLIASRSHDNTVRLWRFDTGAPVAILEVSIYVNWSGASLAFHPKERILAILNDNGNTIQLWELDYDLLLSAPPIEETIQYANAKVVLVGDTGVGKTGLGHRLVTGQWKPTSGSTHGMNVWTLHSKDNREIMLWDFAGQDEYRLVHQLFLSQTNIALLLYDPTKSDDTFFGIDYWEKALANAIGSNYGKMLVAARINVGGVRMTESDIKRYCAERGYLGHYATSAETNKGCDQLRNAILAAIPWDIISTTRSPEVFKRIKDFFTQVRTGGRVLVRERDLFKEFCDIPNDDTPTEAQFSTVVGHVENAGLIKRFSFGDLVLLKPELLNGLASDIIDAARRHSAGLGCVPKSDVLNGKIPIRDEGELSAADKVLLLHATIELFLRLGLALEQDGNLVFPSKFNRKMPFLENDPVVEVEFSFSGPVDNLYTTLVVKLYYGHVFKLHKLWKNAAEFHDGAGKVCGFQLMTRGDGDGLLKVFYAKAVNDRDKALFLKVIADHFKDKNTPVSRQRLYRCPGCGEPVRDRNAVHKALKAGVLEIPYQYCFKPFPLIDAVETLYRDERQFIEQIHLMEARADSGIQLGGDLVSASAELRSERFLEWAGGTGYANIAVVFTDVIDSTRLNREMGDSEWGDARRMHFGRAQAEITNHHGYLIKNVGDGVMAAFRNSIDAVDFALSLARATGHDRIRIRAGIHIGQVQIETDDAFGQHVNMTNRICSEAKTGGIWVSERVKQDFDSHGGRRELRWKKQPERPLKGFDGQFVLWIVE